MKTQMVRIAVCAMTLLAVSAAMAQGRPGDVVVNVPFAFVVGSHQMQPGRYVVTPMTQGILRMYDTEVSNNQLFLPVNSIQSNKPKDPKLVFHRYGDTYFLSEVWNGNSDIGRQLVTSKAEKEIASGRVSGSRPKAEIAVLRPER
jgi:hypothetical protein